MVKKFDCIILGAGPAGLSASIYLARANVKCCIIDTGLAGGRPNGYLEIENYLGLGKTSTEDMLSKFIKHVEYFKIPIFECEEILSVDLENKMVTTIDETFKAKAIIIASGSRPRKLNVRGEEELIGKGVHYCAICDGHFYKNKIATVIGGGNSACEEALGLADICKFVYIIQDMPHLTCDEITINLIKERKNILPIYKAKVLSINGYKHVEGVLIQREISPSTKEVKEILTDAIFPYIGMEANSEMFNVNKNRGFIVTDQFMQTNISGVYAIGDVRVKVLRQVITSVADGAIAGVQVSRYLKGL